MRLNNAPFTSGDAKNDGNKMEEISLFKQKKKNDIFKL